MARNNEFLKARSTQYAAYATVYILIIIGVLGLVNWLANRYNKSYDSTANKRYSLSDQSIKILKNLKQPVTMTYFDDPNRPQVQQARDLLSRYSDETSKVTVNYVDPVKKPLLARAAGLQTVPAVVIQAGDKRQETKALSEEEVTSAMVRLLKGGERTMCAVTGEGEHSLDDSGRSGYSELKALAERNNYKTRTITLLSQPQVPKDCTELLVGGPRLDYAPTVVNAIKTYLEGGGRVLFLLSPPLQVGNEQVAENTGLVNLLQSYGVTADKDLVLDTSGLGQLFGLNEVAPVVTTYEQSPITQPLGQAVTVFPFSRSLVSANAGKVTTEKLFSTTENSFATYNLANAEIKIDPNKDKHGPFTLGVSGSYNTGNPSNPGRFVVVGSADWLDNQFLQARQVANRDLVLNMMNWLSSDEDLISIRPKPPEDRPLTLNGRQMTTLMLASVILFPLLAIISGVSVWWKRR